MESNEITFFHWADYLLFGISLALSASIGVYYAIADRRQKSTETVLMGGRSMGALPVALSLFASFMSAISFLGIPSDTYSFGFQLVGMAMGKVFATPFVAHLIVPTFHSLEIKSMYQYFELRYRRGNIARIAASVVFVFQMIFYMAVVLYAPALAFSQVTGISVEVSILAVGGVCALYTALGGIKAVVWTDTLQMIILFAGMFALVIQGTILSGGFTHVWERAVEGGRVQPISFSMDPTIRYTFWGMFIGTFFTDLVLEVGNQASVQRYMAIKTLKSSQVAVYLTLPLFFITIFCLCYIGILAYAFFDDCDPMLAGKISSRDQMVPLMVMDVFGVLPGLSGLFLASVFSAALSTVSSGLNSLSAVILEDFIKPCFLRNGSKALTDRRATIVSQILAFSLGLVTIGLAFLPSVVDAFLFQLAATLFGMTGGPLVGMLMLALFCPCSNVWGSFFGLLFGLATTLWIGIGGILYPPKAPYLEFSLSGCNATNMTVTEAMNVTSFADIMTTPTLTTGDPVASEGFRLEDIYGVSYLWYGMIGCFSTLIFGILISFLTGRTKGDDVNPSLVISLGDKLCCCLPESLRKSCRCGVEIDDTCGFDLEEKTLTHMKDCDKSELGVDNKAYTMSQM